MATDKTEKHSRIIILMAKGCTKLVRKVTIKSIEKSTPVGHVPDPWTIDQFLSYHRNEICKRKPNAKQMRLLFPASESAVDIEEWDIQLICFILLGFCSVTSVMEMDLQELKKLRNKLYHKGDPSISDAEYEGYLVKLKVIIQRLLKAINNSDLNNEMNTLVEYVEHGALSLGDTIKVVKDWYDRETDIEHQLECIQTEQKETSQRLNILNDTMMGFKTDHSKVVETLAFLISLHYPGITIPETDVKLLVVNCNEQSEKFISERLVKLLDPKLRRNFAEEDHDTINQCVIKAMCELLTNGTEVVKVEQSCVIIRLKCPSFESLKDLWTKCVQGELTKLFEPVQQAIRCMDGFNNVGIEIILTETEFWRCVEDLVSAIAKCAEQDFSQHAHERSEITAVPRPISDVVRPISDVVRPISDVVLDNSTGECASGSNDKSGTCIRMRIKPQSLDQLIHIWHTCKSGRLNRHLKRVSEAFQDQFGLDDLSIKATIDEQKLLDYVKEIQPSDRDGTRDTTKTVSTGKSQEKDRLPIEHQTEKGFQALASTDVSPQQEDKMLKDDVKKDVEPLSTMDRAIGQLEFERKDDEGVGDTMLGDEVKKDIEPLSTMDTDIGQLEDERKDDEAVGGTTDIDIEQLEQLEDESEENEGAGDTTESMSQSTPLNMDASPSIQHLRTPRDVLNKLVIEIGGQTLMDTIIQRVKDMGKIFCNKIVEVCECKVLRSKKILQAGENKYFETLESILQRKMKESGKDLQANPYGLDEAFHRSLFACCLDIKLSEILWYRDETKFPWILDIFEMKPYHFYTMFDILREVAIMDARELAHLTHIEECILENLAWKSDSPLWVCIQSRNQVVPTSAEVSLHIQPETKIGTISEHLTTTQHMDAFQKVIVNDDRQVQTNFLTPQAPIYSLPHITVKSSSLTPPSSDAIDTVMQPSVTQQHQPSKHGSFDLFFRKVYHLVNVRLRKLCDELDIYDDDLIQKIWACVEHVITSYTDLLKDRHLDQIIMCCIYVMAKVTDKTLSFQTITTGYVFQQTPVMKWRDKWRDKIKVYQRVLLGSRNRLTSKCSDTNRAATSSISSPKDEKKEENSPLMLRSSIWHATKFSNPLTRRDGTETRIEWDEDESNEDESGGNDEDRGHLIQFYNQIFIPQIKTFAMRFLKDQHIEIIIPQIKTFAMRFLKDQHIETQELYEKEKELFLKCDESFLHVKKQDLEDEELELLHMKTLYERLNEMLPSGHKRTAESDIQLGSSANLLSPKRQRTGKSGIQEMPSTSGEFVGEDLKLSKQPLKSPWLQ